MQLENFKHVDLFRAAGKGRIPEHCTARLALGDFLDNIFRHIAVKAGNQGIGNIQRSITGRVGVDGTVADFLRPIRHGQRQSPIQQTAKQQIKVGAILLDVAFQIFKVGLGVFLGRIIDVLHIGIVQLENTEANVQTIR